MGSGNKKRQTQRQQQQQGQTQEQIISQSYADNTLFMNLSCLESIEQKYLGINQPKQFGAYDVVDYSHRPIQVLKEQLRLGIFQVELSCDAQRENGKNEFVLPNSYNMQKVLGRLEQFKSFFYEKNDKDCCLMVQDLQNILNNQQGQRNYMKMRFQSEKKNSINQNVQNMLVTSQKLSEEESRVKQILYKPNMQLGDIPFRSNILYQNKKMNKNPVSQKQEIIVENMEQNQQYLLNEQKENEKKNITRYVWSIFLQFIVNLVWLILIVGFVRVLF